MAALTDSTVKFDAFAAEHECLEQTLSELRWLLARQQDTGATLETLAVFSNLIATHFVHEEQDDGFFDSVIEQAPRLKQRATELILEHASLAAALRELQCLASRKADALDWWSDLGTSFEAFWKLFCCHERAEIDLVQEAFHGDIGAGD